MKKLLDACRSRLAFSRMALLAGATAVIGLSPVTAGPAVLAIKPTLATAPVPNDPDDPAIWANRRNPAQSRIIATNKVAAKDGGALYVYNMQGKVTQVIKNLDRPNNVDVEYGVKLGGQPIDIAVVTERLAHKLRLYRILPNGNLQEIAVGGLNVFAEETGDRQEPMGIALYKRPRDGAAFAFVSRKGGPDTNFLWQYRLRGDDKGFVYMQRVRTLGAFSGIKEIESICVDDALGYVYYSDEGYGIHKYHADPSRKNSDKEVALFARTGWKGDHEGIAILPTGNRTGYLICTDQIKGNTEYHVYRREGDARTPKTQGAELAIIRGGADETDGIEATNLNLGPRFPRGAFIAMNSTPKNFLVYDARPLLQRIRARR